MSGGWAGSDRRSRLPADWPKRCAQVHKRSGKRCEFPVGFRLCGKPADGGVDHIIRGDNHELSNLRDTCQYHHGHKSSQEGNEARAARKALRRKNPPEQHPGLIRRNP